jgi:hypothetical protein
MRSANLIPASDRFDAQKDTLAHSIQGPSPLSSPPKVPAPAFRLHPAATSAALPFLSATVRPWGCRLGSLQPSLPWTGGLPQSFESPQGTVQISPFSLHLRTDCKLLPLFSRFVNPSETRVTPAHYISLTSVQSTHLPPAARPSEPARPTPARAGVRRKRAN